MRVQPQRLGVDGDGIDIVVVEIGQVAFCDSGWSLAQPFAKTRRECAPRSARLCGTRSAHISRSANGCGHRQAKADQQRFHAEQVWKSPTTGIEPPMPIITAGFGHSSDSACLGLVDERRGIGQLDRRRAAMVDEFDRAVRRNARFAQRRGKRRGFFPGPACARGGRRFSPRLSRR